MVFLYVFINFSISYHATLHYSFNYTAYLNNINHKLCVLAYFEFVGFKDNLKSELLYQDMLVKELAVKTGISRHTLDNYLNVRENIPTADVAVKIADVLGVSVEYLITGKDIRERNIFKDSDIRLLVQNFKRLDADDRKMILAIVQLYTNKRKKMHRGETDRA
jgi:transcriptional regulator with XRE-family HTH domain